MHVSSGPVYIILNRAIVNYPHRPFVPSEYTVRTYTVRLQEIQHKPSRLPSYLFRSRSNAIPWQKCNDSIFNVVYEYYFKRRAQ